MMSSNKDETILNGVFEHQLQKLITEPLQLLPESDFPLAIVTDALDECEDALLMALLADQPKKFFVFLCGFSSLAVLNPAIQRSLEIQIIYYITISMTSNPTATSASF